MFYTTVVFIVHNKSADVKALWIMPVARPILWGNEGKQTRVNDAIASPDKFCCPSPRHSHCH